jgi:hypothetical protein
MRSFGGTSSTYRCWMIDRTFVNSRSGLAIPLSVLSLAPPETSVSATRRQPVTEALFQPSILLPDWTAARAGHSRGGVVIHSAAEYADLAGRLC